MTDTLGCDSDSRTSLPARGALPAETGRTTEALAALLLEKRGYRILCLNWRSRWGEVDIVAEHGDCLVFVEVKARASTGHGRPAEAVTRQKQRKILRAAGLYTILNHAEDRNIRFDVVELVSDRRTGAWELRVLENAFSAGDGYSAL